MIRIFKNLAYGVVFLVVIGFIAMVFDPLIDKLKEAFLGIIGIPVDSTVDWILDHKFISLFIFVFGIGFIYDFIHDIFELILVNISRKIGYTFYGIPTSKRLPFRVKVENKSRYDVICFIEFISLSFNGKAISDDSIVSPRFQWMGVQKNNYGEKLLDHRSKSNLISIADIETNSNKMFLTLIDDNVFRGGVGDYCLECEIRGRVRIGELERPIKPIKIKQKFFVKDIVKSGTKSRFIRIW